MRIGATGRAIAGGVGAALLLAACSSPGPDDEAGASEARDAESATTIEVAPSTTSVPTTTTTTTAPHFRAAVGAVTAEQLHASWRSGCPVPIEQLRAVDATHWGYDGAVHDGRLIVHEAEADAMVAVLRELFDAGFPIEKMEPVDLYGGSDDASIAANNTSAFNCRPATGGTSWSRHAYGRAIDINPLVNPYVKGALVLPPEAAPYLDRTRTDPGMIHDGDAVVAAFARQGWSWGGHWQSLKDYQHFDT